MKDRRNHRAILLFIVSAFILLLFIFSFAGTTTYQYDDANRKVTVTHGTQPASSTYNISGIVLGHNAGHIPQIVIRQ